MSSALSRFARQRDPAVAGGVEVMLDRKTGAASTSNHSRALSHVSRPGDALRAVLVGGQRAEFLQFGDRAFGIDGHAIQK